MARAWIAVLATLLSALALAAPAGAIPIPGPNGGLVFTSGRGGAANDDSKAQIYTYKFPNGPAVQFTFDQVQHSHPAWSPDRTKIAFSVGPDGSRDILIQDVQTKALQTLGNTTGNQDRAAYSPDGTRIAWMSEGDILVQSVGGGSILNLTAADAKPADKPAWTPDSKTIYYALGDVAANDAGISRRNADGSGVSTPVVNDAGVDEWQPAISPDGTKLCYTRGPKSSAAQVYTKVLPAGTPQNFSNSANGGINCVFSPDGTKIGYTKGTFFDGQLGYRNANNTGPFVLLSDAANHFDGNADWVFNPPPTCSGATVTVAMNAFISIPLACIDPAPESQSTSKDIATPPAHGNLGGISNSTVIYTPKLNFTGSDSFTFTGSDGTSDSAPAKINITVTRNPTGNVGGTTGDTQPPSLTRVSVSPLRWRAGSRLPRFALAPKGTTFRFTVDEMALTTFTFAKATSGRRVGGKCVRTTRANRLRRRCIRYVTKGNVRVIARSGANRLRFQGRLSRTRRLTLGRYRTRVGAVDSAGNKSRTRTVFFTIVAR